MKKNIFIFSIVFIILVGFNPSSKSFKFSIGQPVRTGKITYLVVGKFGDDVVILSRDAKNFYYNKMKGTKFISNTKLNLKYQKKSMNYEGHFIKNNELFILSSFYNSKVRKQYYFYRKFDVKQMKESGDLVLIGDIPVKSRVRLGDISVAQSNDSTKIVLYMFNPDRGKKKQEIIFVVLDKDMKVLWKKKSFIKYLDKEFKFTYVTVDNQGVVYFAGKRYFKKSGKKSTPYVYHIFIFKQGEEEPEDIEVNLHKYYINDMVLKVADNGDIVFAGFYSPDKSWTIDGSFYLRLDGKTHEVVSDNYKEFTTSFITQGYSERIQNKAKRKEKKGKNVQFYEYDLNDIVMRSDGGIILVAEQFYITIYTTTSSNGTITTHYTYYFNDIIIVNINNKGIIEWNKKISKSQVSGGPSHLSFVMGVYNNNIYFIVNDNPKNRSITESSNRKAYGGSKNADLVLYTISRDGEIKREFVKNTKPYKFIMSPESSYFSGQDGIFYLTGWYPRKKLLMASVEIE